MIVIGVDPGAACGVAVLERYKLLKAQTINGYETKQILAMVQQIKKIGEERDGVAVVVELQFQGRGGKSNPKTVEKLTKCRHTWEILCELHQIEVVQVWPASWQKELAITNRLNAKGKKRTTKERSLEAARFYFSDEKIAGHDQADASLIARWFWGRRAAGVA